MVAAGMAAETSQRFQGVYDESPRQFKLNGVIDLYKAILLMITNPSLIKRPILDTGKGTIIGFKATTYENALQGVSA